MARVGIEETGALVFPNSQGHERVYPESAPPPMAGEWGHPGGNAAPWWQYSRGIGVVDALGLERADGSLS